MTQAAARPLAFVLALCAAEVLGMLSIATFPALIPTFIADWGLTNTEAGWIGGIYFAGYVAAVPVLVTLTDRIDARAVLLGSLALGMLAALGYAAFADGFWTALAFRTLQGIGLAGTYMPGLKVLSDRTEGPRQSRYVSFYTASYGIGTALSYWLAGAVAEAFGWRTAFAATAVGSLMAALILLGMLRPSKPAPHERRLFDFAPALRIAAVRAFVLGYSGHNWELFAFRAWVVAYLTFAEMGRPAPISATAMASLVALAGVASSILGNEAALRFGRRRAILWVTAGSVCIGVITGFAAGWSWGAAAVCVVLYALLTIGDSAALTAGTVAAAPPGARGTTLALHAGIGTAGAVVGSVAVGIALDLAAGPFAWVAAFAVMAAGSAFAFAAVARLRS
jgi:MFS family permease